MQEEINYSQAPHNYQICFNHKCRQANTCLRQLIEPSVPTDIQSLIIINPKHLATLEGACPYYRPFTKVRFAKGFIKLLEELPYKQMQTVIAKLSDYFSERTYYRVRKGERLLSPSEQKIVLNILKNCGVSHPQDFDAYIEQYNW